MAVNEQGFVSVAGIELPQFKPQMQPASRNSTKSLLYAVLIFWGQNLFKMISQEILSENDRKNLEAEKWLLNTEFNQAKFFNETGHQFFKDGRYKKYKQATQLDVTKRILFALEALEREYLQRVYDISRLNEKVSELENEISELKGFRQHSI